MAHHRHKFPKTENIPYGGMALECACGFRVWRYRKGNQVPLVDGVKNRKVVQTKSCSINKATVSIDNILN